MMVMVRHRLSRRGGFAGDVTI